MPGRWILPGTGYPPNVPVTSNLGRYQYVSTLGSGGMGTVVLAEDTLLGRQVALKRMHAAADVRNVSRLRREALLGASVSHPNLVSIYDVLTEEDGELVIVMEYVPGETLAAALTRVRRFPAPEALRLLEGVAAGMDAIHRRGIVHRDVKPPNILLSPDGAVKLTDLGIALIPDRTRITSAGAVIGSFRYMAPEQLEDAPSSPAIDIYALAAMAFEVLSGRQAHQAPNPLALAHAMSTQPPPDLRSAWPDAPPEAAAVLKRAMSRAPGERPGSAGELVRRLRAALVSEDTAEVTSPPPPVAFTPAPRRVAPTPRRPPPVPSHSTPAAPRSAPGGTEPRRDFGRRHAWPVAAGLLSLAAVAILLAVLVSGGSSDRSQPNPAHVGGPAGTAGRAGAQPVRHRGTTASRGAPAAASGTTTSAPGSARSTSASAGAGTPTAAVESFYKLAVSHRYADAWALADTAFRSQLGGYDSFQAGQAADRSIAFDSARVVSQSSQGATVAVQTTSARADGTQHCGGTVDLLPGASSGAWVLHQIHITCA